MSEGEQGNGGLQRVIDALQKHQQMLAACSEQEQQVVEALNGLQTPELSDLLKRNLGLPSHVGLATNSGGHKDGSYKDGGYNGVQGTDAIEPDDIVVVADGGNWTKQYLNGAENQNVNSGDEALQKAMGEFGKPAHTHDLNHPTHKTFTQELKEIHNYVEAVEGALWSQPVRQLLRSRGFELFCTAVMLANVVGMIVRLEFEGLLVGEELGVLRNTGVGDRSLEILENIEVFFTLWFTVELALRFWVYGCKAMLKDAMNVFDVLVVIGTLVDLIMTRLLAFEGGMNLSVARMLRLVKVLKFLRTFKAASAFTELRVLLRTVMRSTMALLWALIVLSLIIITSSNFMAQLLGSFISDSGNNLETRKWVYEHYGTASRAAWTVLEATLSGGWPNYANVLVMEVNPLWALWWFLYVFFVIFAVIRVMGALFLTASLKAASEDQDMQALVRIKDFQKCGKQLREIFRSPEVLVALDASMQKLSSEKKAQMAKDRERHMLHHDLEYILSRPKSVHQLNRFGFETVEIRLLFDILARGAHKVEWEVFLKACMRLKSGVKAIDVIEILHAVERSSQQPASVARRPRKQCPEKDAVVVFEPDSTQVSM